MSIDINWDTFTTGPEGSALAEQIRDFIHTKFQSIALPRFLQSVQVHAFDFGDIAPDIELKDICDPLPEFYEDNEGDDVYSDDNEGEQQDEISTDSAQETRGNGAQTLRERRRTERWAKSTSTAASSSDNITPAVNPDIHRRLDSRLPGLRSIFSPVSELPLGSPSLRAPTPGLSGGTSNLSYFHSPLSAGLSGAHTPTPLAAAAGLQYFPGSWLDRGGETSASTSSISPPSTANSSTQTPQPLGSETFVLTRSSSEQHIDGLEQADETAFFPLSDTLPPPPKMRPRHATDIQLVAHVRYTGNVKLSLTASILLDYPMPSFVGIPVHLNITGLSFDGVGIAAYTKRRAHFCFLAPEDAITFTDRENAQNAIGKGESGPSEFRASKGTGTSQDKGSNIHHNHHLLHSIKVESEIGQRDAPGGKQSSLRNVGKVEKFVLEQVRRLFDDELVWPSFWTILV
ncbi:MAG: Mitochondrial distribution and morphology protein 12 [Trizodia sp. TS-e1964]|nr:MAG: Mitochondrial distribution and morphology protein 12 [Trizodia sp. TS-e1964]